ncbi:MAG: glycosyltransferase family 39 protein [Flavobacteriales bacterium]|nr:glycosyltransferase family 39 protein [Flavobacteriales bacterium]
MSGVIYFCLKSNTLLSDYLTWDEVHYATLAEKGIAYNALEKNSLNFIAFYKIGKARADKDTLLNKQLVKEYNYPDENLNPFYLRHYHPPLATYYWSLFTSNSNIYEKAKSIRFSNIILGILIVICLISTIYIIKSKKRYVFTGILLVIFLLVTSNIFNYSLETINLHTFQFLFAVLFMAFLMRWLNESTKKNAIYLGASVAFMFLTLETALFVVAGAILALLVTKQIKKLFQFAVPIFGSFLVFLVAMWPGVIKTLAPIKTWVMYAARIFLKGNDEYVKVDMAASWKTLFIENLPLFGTIIILVIALLFLARKTASNKLYLIPYIIAFTYFIAITPFILNKTYIFPVIGLLIFAIIYNLAVVDFSKFSTFSTKYSKLNYLVIPVFAIYITYLFVDLDYKTTIVNKQNESKLFNEDINELQQLIKGKENIIAFNGQLLRYYLQDESIVDLRKNQKKAPGFYVRENGLYKDVTTNIMSKEIEAIIIPLKYLGYYPTEKTRKLEAYGYKKINLQYFQIFVTQE